MGSILTGVGLAAAATALDTILIQSPKRSIQTASGTMIIPDVTIEERLKDEMEITQIPVEQGSPVSDHAFKKPAEVTMRIAWSSSKNLSNLISGALSGTTSLSITDVYNQLLALQTATSTPPYLQPFTLTTGKRTYKNMLLRSLQVVTNVESENALMVEAIFQQLNIVTTQVQSTSTLLGQTQNQANPQNTAPPVSSGNVQLGPSNAAAGSTVGGLQ